METGTKVLLGLVGGLAAGGGVTYLVTRENGAGALGARVTFGATSIPQGESVTATITMTNTGEYEATGVAPVLTIRYPDGSVFKEMVGAIGSPAPGKTITYTPDYATEGEPTGQYTYELEVTCDNAPTATDSGNAFYLESTGTTLEASASFA